MFSKEVNDKIYLGDRLVRMVLQDDGKFYRRDDNEKKTPLDAKPIPQGLRIISMYRHRQEYGPSFEEEYSHELGDIVGKLASKEEIENGKIGVCCGYYHSDQYPVQFYRINQG